MESVELKEKVKIKRIKHSFPRQEVYHRWIHSSEYCYTKSGQRYAVSGFKDWLIAGDFGKRFTESYKEGDVENAWHGWRKESCIAVINRDTKHIIVNIRWTKQANELIHCIPDNYTIFKTEENITRADILSTGWLEDALRLHSNYLIEQFAQHHADLWLAASGIKKVCHKNYDDCFSIVKPGTYALVDYTNIVKFVKKYKIKQYSWYSKDNNIDIWIYNYKGYSKELYKIKRPTLKQIITKKVFDNATILRVKQIYFYTKYCYGRGISYKFVENNWNKPATKEEFERLQNNFSNPMSWDDLAVKPVTWNESVEIIFNAIINKYELLDKHNTELSERYYKEALFKIKEINEQEYSVNHWREGNLQNLRVNYQHWIKSYKIGVPGRWVTNTIFSKNISFANIQLRLIDNYKTVNTSKKASVSLDDAIKMWKLYISLTKGRVGIKGQPIFIRLEDRRYNVGIYNLRAIKYCQKKTDDGKLLDKWEWCVIIGCHYIWIDDFINFVEYYKLYDLFVGIKHPEPVKVQNNEVKNNKPFKIKIK